VKEDVIIDVKDNYVQYHMSDEDSEVWVIEDFNRVSVVDVTLQFYVRSTLLGREPSMSRIRLWRIYETCHLKRLSLKY